ncbi:hypothetical protein BD779DRAFT_1612503 [Infundibulicybe gibba]|nr:hypothetical protein BD779DRAFT_1612503 [Infundibulicybe gibba]
MPWQSGLQQNNQPHDESTPEAKRKNYFGPSCFYCVETICAPCGVVIAWTKFDKAESPTIFCNFLRIMLVLRTSIANKSWEMWSRTSAPLDGSAPNLVPYYQRAFNTQARGFESILRRMTPGNFNWFLYVIDRQKQKAKQNQVVEEVEEDEDEVL